MTEKEYRKELKNKLINYRYLLGLPKDITFGVEIEYENLMREEVNAYLEELKYYNPKLINWTNKSEIDIAEYNADGEEMNGEVVSPILIDEINTWKSLEEVLIMLNNKGALITNACGGHVNVGIHIFDNNIEYFKNMILLWLLYVKSIRKFSRGEFNKLRSTKSIHFMPLSVKKLLNTSLKNDIKSIYELDPSLFDKKHEIYMHKLDGNKVLEDDRIEFRLPNGSIQPEIWQNYINFFSRFLLSCKKELDREKIIYDIKNNNGDIINLVDYVFDSELDKENFLIQSLKTNYAYKKELNMHKSYMTNV